jgi:GNAT superfamily N-acetyltransferase
VRVERVTDLGSVWPLLTSLLRELHEHHQPFWPRDFLSDWQARWREYLQSGEDRCILLAWRNGEPIGYTNAALRRDPGLFRETFCHIDDAYVRPNARRLGIGGKTGRSPGSCP